MTANPMTRTGISVSLMRAETVAGDNARISVPSVKISPLINTTRRNSAAAGMRARFISSAWSAGYAFVHTGRIPRKWVSDPMVTRGSAADTGLTMHISRITVPGNDAVVHHMTTRRGERLCLMLDDRGDRHLFAYDEGDRDAPAWEILLQPDEADQVAEILHTRPIADRLLLLERRVDELIGERGR